MNQGRSLVARRRAYGLLGALLVDGMNAERLELVRGVPPLAEHLPPNVQLEQLAADHHALFGQQVHPFAGVFMDDSGLVGAGPPSQVVRQAFAVLGVRCADEPAPDHLGVVLRLLALLTDAQLDAWEHAHVDDVRVLQRWQRRVLDEAALPWVAPLHAAITAQPVSVWTRAVEMAIGLVAQHRAQDPEAPSAAASPSGTDLCGLLDDPKTGLRTLADALTTPARCGVYLARHDIAAMARGTELPTGFGGRRGMMERLLLGAAEYGLLPRVVEQLGERLHSAQLAHTALDGALALGPHVAPWTRRIEGTRQLLRRFGDGVRAATTG